MIIGFIFLGLSAFMIHRCTTWETDESEIENDDYLDEVFKY